MNKESVKIAVTVALTAFHENPGCSRQLEKHYIQRAHEALLKESGETPLEVSMVILLSDYKKALWVSAGDTRMVGIRNKKIKWKTKDTSLKQETQEQSEHLRNQIESRKKSHNLYCYLGQREKFKPVTYHKRNLKHGDIMVLYTYGACNVI